MWLLPYILILSQKNAKVYTNLYEI